MSMSGRIYSGRCTRCGRHLHAATPFRDGDRAPHGAFATNHNGYTTGIECEGLMVSIMGRTTEEIYRVSDEIRRASAK